MRDGHFVERVVEARAWRRLTHDHVEDGRWAVGAAVGAVVGGLGGGRKVGGGRGGKLLQLGEPRGARGGGEDTKDPNGVLPRTEHATRLERREVRSHVGARS